MPVFPRLPALALAALMPMTSVAAPVIGDAAAIRAAAKARLAEEAGDARTALAALADVSSFDPGSAGLAARVLEQAVIAGDLRRATDAANRLWLSGEQRFDARIILLVDAIRRGDWRMARSFATETTAKSGPELTARLISPITQGWIDVALRERSPDRHLAKLSAAGGDPTAQWIGASMLLMSGAKVEAERRAAALVPINRTSQIVAARLAVSFKKRGSVDAAVGIESALTKRVAGGAADPLAGIAAAPLTTPAQGIGQWFALLGDGFARTPGGSEPLALLFTRAANWLDPNDPYAQLALAEALTGSEQGDAALAVLERGGSGRPANNPFALRRAELLSERGDHSAAIALITASGADLPGDAASLIRLAEIAQRAKDDIFAGAVFDKLLAMSTDDDLVSLRAPVLIAKSELFMRQDRWSEARPLLEAALAANPNDPATLNFVGYSALERRDNVPQALARIEAAWAKDKRNAAITDSLGWAYLLTGDVDQAVVLLEQASRGEPNSPVINEHFGDALWKSGRQIEARYAWRIAALGAEGAMTERLTVKLADGLTEATLAP